MLQIDNDLYIKTNFHCSQILSNSGNNSSIIVRNRIWKADIGDNSVSTENYSLWYCGKKCFYLVDLLKLICIVFFFVL